jgi:methylated-DNA-[protein]-cysteine S-methyltransferase
LTSAVITRLASPVGELRLLANAEGLAGVWFETSRHGRPEGAEWPAADGRGRAGEILARTRDQLEEYFARRRTVFDLPLAPQGTPFQLRVWNALRAIPYGTTESYGGLARRIGTPTSAARAVGAANGQNPIPIIVPCHRVIGANGDLVGFGGGLERKRWLLVHEGAIPAPLDISMFVDV